MKNIMIAGASGFIGTILATRFLQTQNRVVGLGTSPSHPLIRENDRFSWVSADTTGTGKWQESVGKADIIINLTGRSIFSYWTGNYKKVIHDSRVLTTNNIVDALGEDKDQVLLNASAVGLYGDGGDDTLTEDRPAGRGFLAGVCRDWEKTAKRAQEKGARVAMMRFGIVLGRGGALDKMVPAFKMFAGGPLGGGRHWFPWIHIDDLVRALEFILDNPDLCGEFNFTGPEPIRQKAFAAALGDCLNRPSIMPAPGFIIRLVMGELGEALLQSQKAVPDHLLKSGFEFRFPGIRAALTDILKS